MISARVLMVRLGDTVPTLFNALINYQDETSKETSTTNISRLRQIDNNICRYCMLKRGILGETSKSNHTNKHYSYLNDDQDMESFHLERNYCFVSNFKRCRIW